jgi:uncharacterized protein with FMN-binding domain
MVASMKRIALSLLVIAASGAYVWVEAGSGPAGPMLAPASAADGTEAGRAPTRAALMATAAAPAAAPAKAPPVASDGAPPDRRSASAGASSAGPNRTTAGRPPAAVILAGAAPVLPVGRLSGPPVMPAAAAAVAGPPAGAATVPEGPAAAPPEADLPTQAEADGPADPIAAAAMPAAARAATPAGPVQPDAAPVVAVAEPVQPEPAVAVDVPLPRPRPAPPPLLARLAAPLTLRMADAGMLSDGVYTGPPVDAFYGLVQVQAVVAGGRLTGVNVLQFPSHRGTSVAINRQALPMLQAEVVTAQSADVDIISGATLTSEAYIRSLREALRQGAA